MFDIHEGPSIEFKRIWSESAKKTVAAFANTDGGTLYIGVDDDGSVVGLKDPDACIVQAAQSVTDGIVPDVAHIVDMRIAEYEQRSVVIVDVQRGTSRPYYLADKGIRPAGVYVRMGAASVPSSDAAILRMIRESSDDSFEDSRSVDQQLTFEHARETFAEANAEFGEREQRTLGLLDETGLYTNLAWLLSDQCTASIKAAVFQGDTKAVFKTRYEFSGSLFRQFRQVAEFIDRYNNTRSRIGEQWRRVDYRDYAPEVLRETLLNLIVHRDYTFSGPGLISIFDHRIEMLNLGGLPKGLTERDMMLGISQQRNPRLAQVLYRLKWVEAYGTGIPRIVENYADCDRKPEFRISDNAFKVVLPSRIAGKDGNGGDREDDALIAGVKAEGSPTEGSPMVGPKVVGSTTASDLAMGDRGAVPTISPTVSNVLDGMIVTPRMRRNAMRLATPAVVSNGSVVEERMRIVLNLAERQSEIRRSDVQQATGLSQAGAVNLLRELVGRGLLLRVGVGRNTRYRASA
ncbi:transcriptional regulator [Bifidobacterium margollesii]|uniref:Transcriptional regulator n=1 Tax=Bifidobacterium margollesii TaxID=2020964 RepID=A0A2N5JCJ0_9BIFI|nr:RNA-binding domain-containing protein [Bifidobacterium margollesii]PLS31936.1 transcriptional regulator [Bifidobacterium margollesii]